MRSYVNDSKIHKSNKLGDKTLPWRTPLRTGNQYDKWLFHLTETNSLEYHSTIMVTIHKGRPAFTSDVNNL